MSKHIKISIIIPFYKGERFYPVLLRSVKRAISMCNAETVSFEIITVIDSVETPREGILSIVQHHFDGIENIEITIVKNERNIGVAGSRNVAISLSKGDYFHIIDQDDEVSESYYSEVLALVDDYSFVLTNGSVDYINVNYNQHKLYYFVPDLSIKGLLVNDFIRSPGQVVFSRKLLKNRLFPEPKDFKGADDRFFWIRLFVENKGNIKPSYISKTNYIAHIHDENYSTDEANLKKSGLENWMILRKELDLTKYDKIISRDVLRLKQALNDDLGVFERLIGLWKNLIYFLEPNKLLRFVMKRKKW